MVSYALNRNLTFQYGPREILNPLHPKHINLLDFEQRVLLCDRTVTFMLTNYGYRRTFVIPANNNMLSILVHKKIGNIIVGKNDASVKLDEKLNQHQE